MNLVRLGTPVSHISLLMHFRTINDRIKLHRRIAWFPQNLYFDEFCSVKHMMSVICCDAVFHQLIAKLSNRLSKSITLKIVTP